MHYQLAEARVLIGDGRYWENGFVEVMDQRIVAIGPSSSMPKGAIRVPLDGRVVIPGMIDLHTHLVGGDKIIGRGDNATSYKMTEPLAKAVLDSIEAAAVTVRAGVTTVQDLGSRDYVDVFMRDGQAAGMFLAPRILAAGPGVFVPGGHGSFWEPDRGVEGVDEVVRRVRELSLRSVDVIKVVSADGPEFSGDWTTAQSTSEEIAAAFAEGRRLGKRTTAHAMGAEAMINAALGGAETVQHGWYLTEEAVETLVGSDCFLVPTLGEVVDIVKNGPALDMPWAEDFASERNKIFERITFAIDAGVKIAMGSDCGGVEAHFHGANAEELVWYQECGLSSEEALATATINAARALRLEDHLGTLEEGKVADILVLEDDPRDDLRNLTKALVCVIQSGVPVRDDRALFEPIQFPIRTMLAKEHQAKIDAFKAASSH